MLLAKLKQNTQFHHRQIESDLDLLSREFDLAAYRNLLRRFLGYYEPWESAILDFEPSLLEGRSKCAQLRADLCFLDEPLAEIPSVSLCNNFPMLDTVPRITGSMYVIEGATLGGQILCRHFAARFHLGEVVQNEQGSYEKGNAFFTGYGNRTGAMWKQFANDVNAIPEEQSDEVIASAIATFTSMHSWLCEPPIEILGKLVRHAPEQQLRL